MFIYAQWYEYSFTNLYNDIDYGEFIAIIKSNRIETNQKNKYICQIISIDKNKKYKNTKLILYTDKKLEFEYGDILKITGKFEYAKQDRNFNGFNYRRNLWQNKIYGILNCDFAKKIGIEKNLEFYLNKIKNQFELNIEVSVKNIEYAGLLKSILLGQKSNISEETKEIFRDASLSHILAISGMHFSYIAIFIKRILAFINNKKTKIILYLIIMFLFVLLVGGTPSSLRAFIMVGLLSFSDIVYRKSNAIINFFSALFIIVLINPFYIENVGLWLSFGGTCGIIVLYSKIKFKFKYKVLDFIFQNFILSVCVQIFIFPIIIYNFNTISLSFFISNIFISLLIGPIILLGIIIGIFKNIFFFGNLEYFLLDVIFKISTFISKLSFSKIYIKTPLLIYIIFYYIFLFLMLYKRKYIKILLKVIFACILLVNFMEYLTNEFTIYFIDVGQGDSTLIKTKSNKTILIDGGEGENGKFDEGKNTVIPYLLDRGYTKLDYIIISHFDSDHVGGILTIIEELKVSKIIISKQGEDSENFKKFIEIVSKRNIEIIVVSKADRLVIDKDVWIEILWPDSLNIIKENILNNNSIVCKIHYKNFSCLFTGDIEKNAEEKILLEKINFESTVLKVAHHGSNTSTIQEFLKNVKPKIALIGVGENNKFNHPNDEVIERLESLKTQIYRTDLKGEIKIEVYENEKIQISTHIN